jgi:hypothetical protein
MPGVAKRKTPEVVEEDQGPAKRSRVDQGAADTPTRQAEGAARASPASASGLLPLELQVGSPLEAFSPLPSAEEVHMGWEGSKLDAENDRPASAPGRGVEELPDFMLRLQDACDNPAPDKVRHICKMEAEKLTSRLMAKAQLYERLMRAWDRKSERDQTIISTIFTLLRSIKGAREVPGQHGRRLLHLIVAHALPFSVLRELVRMGK